MLLTEQRRTLREVLLLRFHLFSRPDTDINGRYDLLRPDNIELAEPPSHTKCCSSTVVSTHVQTCGDKSRSEQPSVWLSRVSYRDVLPIATMDRIRMMCLTKKKRIQKTEEEPHEKSWLQELPSAGWNQKRRTDARLFMKSCLPFSE